MANIYARKSLQDLLAEALPKDVPFTFYHYSTPPSKSPPLFSAPPNHKPERTYCESHFLAASITQKSANSHVASEELLILAIEVLVYTTKNLTTLFVSKADSTGFLSVLNLPRSQGGSPLKTICGIFISWLVQERQREGTKLIVSLFARAQDQYLFPASIENKNKHVLDDRGLVKWWCRVLDPILGDYAAEGVRKPLAQQLVESKEDPGDRASAQHSASTTAKGYLVVPGFDLHDTLRYLPPPQSSSGPRRWTASHPLLQIAPYPAAPPRCLVPHFPDDPKARFLDELDEELPDRASDEMLGQGGTPSRSNGQWKSIKTLDQFWEMMAFRQECSSGRIVGFIWVVITPSKPSIPEEDGEGPDSQPLLQKDSQESPAPFMSPPKKKNMPKKSRRGGVNTTSGPIPFRLPRIKTTSSSLSSSSIASSASTSSKLPPESTPYFIWPSTSRGSIVFSAKNYNRAHEILLQHNFATQTATARSTKKFKEEVAVLGGIESWGWTILGKKEPTITAETATNGISPVTIMGVRKKRRPDTEEAPQSTEEEADKDVQALGARLVHKKAKVGEPVPILDAGAANGVNTLGVGLVRKKPKQ
ncbi:hypothetical protein CC78DRAFT_515944 [Lojkania enalia]|uniref:histone acetyltransferase n=1 Tax=Lojkania enalia TaxID=147567 RepID=A0A9P4N0N6_9PLEO|nr:hypothetical protein CC78DRAFT_515944 [Didymosphaeria enalia]